MAKRKTDEHEVEETDETEEVETDDDGQMELLDVSSPLAKALKPWARKMKEAIAREYGGKQDKIEYRHKIVEIVRKHGVQGDPETGIITIRTRDLTIVITPQDEKVKVTLPEEEED